MLLDQVANRRKRLTSTLKNKFIIPTHNLSIPKHTKTSQISKWAPSA